MASWRSTLEQYFGFEDLYPIQREVVERVLGGDDALVVLPTGSGKSLCYQLPALVRREEGITLVFCPLIALMEDQVAALKARGIRAEYINSTLDRPERERRYKALGEGEYDLIYATPERMYKEAFVEALLEGSRPLVQLAVDEAHCVTKWGHDFRPAYQEVGRFREQLGSPVTLALTATATRRVREDIRETLGRTRDEMPLFATGIARPNLSLEAVEVWDDDEKIANIKEVAARGGCGIVYFTLIKTIEEYLPRLRREMPGTPIEVYHGRLPAAEKKRVYDRFSKSTPEEGLLLLATNAFGMGVDKADIRSIVHAQVPGSVEAYYQEVGRAGRDGLPSICRLLYQQADLAIQQDFVEWLNPSGDLLLDAAHLFERDPTVEWEADELRASITGRNRGDRRTESCLTALEKWGVIERSGQSERFRFVRPLRPDEIDPDQIDEKRQRDLLRLLDIVKLTRAEEIAEFVYEYFELDAGSRIDEPPAPADGDAEDDGATDSAD